jgi:AcrR family transcriptional regulator
VVSNLVRGMKEENHILERLLSLFKRYGIRSITMDDIASELGVSKKTLYHDFKDKNDLINRVIDYDMGQSRSLMEELVQSDIDAIHEIILVNKSIHQVRSRYSPSFYYDLKRNYPETYRRWLNEKRRSMYDLIVGNLQKGKREGYYRREIHDHTIGRLYMARMEMLDSSEIIEGHESLSTEFMQEIITYHLHGICNENGLKILSELKDETENQQVKEI